MDLCKRLREVVSPYLPDRHRRVVGIRFLLPEYVFRLGARADFEAERAASFVHEGRATYAKPYPGVGELLRDKWQRVRTAPDRLRTHQRYIRWSKASSSERAEIIWSEHRELVVVILVTVVVVEAWLLWSYITEAAVWFGRYSEEVRNLMLAIGVGAAIFGGWVAYQRSRTDRMRAETDRLRQVTESFAKAVELLGHEDRSVRLGAIYALERIARQNRDEHWPVMETLTAYVREWSERKWLEVAETQDDEIKRGLPPSPLAAAPADIQAVFTVPGRRRLDHEGNVGLEPRRLNLDRAYLVEASPDPSPQREFGGASLRGANLSRAKLSQAGLKGADLSGATLAGAVLQYANLKSANLSGSDLERASLFQADLEYVNLKDGNLKDADVGFVNLPYGITQEQLNSACGDKYTQIPHDRTRPAHWLDPSDAPHP